jgi:hypothetical protein
MKLTLWFPGTVKPVRVGVYQQHCGIGTIIGYQYWNGKKWSSWSSSAKGAILCKQIMAAPDHQNDPWRGVLK